MKGRGAGSGSWQTRAVTVGAASIVFLFAALLPDLLGVIGARAPLRDSLGSYSLVPIAFLQVLICLAGAAVSAGGGAIVGLEQLGLRAPVLPGLSFGLASTLPMLLGLGVAATVAPSPPSDLVRVALTAPIAEEVMFRGFLFRQLYARAGLGLWLSALLVALIFGLGHLGQGIAGNLSLAGLLGIVVITAIGSLLFSWLLVRWRLNLWVPIALHAFMNLWWAVFAVDETALGSRVGNVTRVLTILLAVGLTLRLTSRPDGGGASDSASTGDPA